MASQAEKPSSVLNESKRILKEAMDWYDAMVIMYVKPYEYAIAAYYKKTLTAVVERALKAYQAYAKQQIANPALPDKNAISQHIPSTFSNDIAGVLRNLNEVARKYKLELEERDIRAIHVAIIEMADGKTPEERNKSLLGAYYGLQQFIASFFLVKLVEARFDWLAEGGESSSTEQRLEREPFELRFFRLCRDVDFAGEAPFCDVIAGILNPAILQMDRNEVSFIGKLSEYYNQQTKSLTAAIEQWVRYVLSLSHESRIPQEEVRRKYLVLALNQFKAIIAANTQRVRALPIGTKFEVSFDPSLTAAPPEVVALGGVAHVEGGSAVSQRPHLEVGGGVLSDDALTALSASEVTLKTGSSVISPQRIQQTLAYVQEMQRRQAQVMPSAALEEGFAVGGSGGAAAGSEGGSASSSGTVVVHPDAARSPQHARRGGSFFPVSTGALATQTAAKPQEGAAPRQ